MPIDVYERITARIVQQLECGTVPWRKPWRGGEAGQPRNLISGHRYRGINTFLLACVPHDSPYWLTFRQTKQLGGHVRKGEKSTPVVFWKWREREDPDSGRIEKFPLLRHYSVFNSEQCDLPPEKVPAISPVQENDFEPIAACERAVTEMPDPPTIHQGGGSAFYRPVSDTVQVPRPERFDEPGEYYSTVFHELTHSTGHRSRLARPGVTDEIRFSSRTYSKEELIAEMGAAFLCGHCGIENTVIGNSVAYIAGWLQKLRDDKRLVVHAAAAAQKAADHILGRPFDTVAGPATNERVSLSTAT